MCDGNPFLSGFFLLCGIEGRGEGKMKYMSRKALIYDNEEKGAKTEEGKRG